MTPERVRLQIAHDETAVPEQPRDLEVQLSIPDFPGIDYAVEAEMSPRCRDDPPSQPVIDDLPGWIGEHIERIGPGLLSAYNPEHKFIGLHESPGLADRDDPWLGNGGKCVCHLARPEFLSRDGSQEGRGE
mgnify:CR=1 FL=1